MMEKRDERWNRRLSRDTDKDGLTAEARGALGGRGGGCSRLGKVTFGGVGSARRPKTYRGANAQLLLISAPLRVSAVESSAFSSVCTGIPGCPFGEFPVKCEVPPSVSSSVRRCSRIDVPHFPTPPKSWSTTSRGTRCACTS